MLKETERLGLSMTNLAELLWSMAKTSMCKAHKSVRLSGQTLQVFFMHTDAFQKNFFPAEFRTAKNPTFQTHSSSSSSCLPPSVYSGIHQCHYCHARLISSREMKTSSHFKVQAKG